MRGKSMAYQGYKTNVGHSVCKGVLRAVDIRGDVSRETVGSILDRTPNERLRYSVEYVAKAMRSVIANQTSHHEKTEKKSRSEQSE